MTDIGFYRFWGAAFPGSCDMAVTESFRPVIRSLLPNDLTDASLPFRPDVQLVPEPEGPHGPSSVSVRSGEKTIGYLPAEQAAAWAGPVRRVIASGLLPVIETRIWGREWNSPDGPMFLSQVRLNLGDPAESLPSNEPPNDPYTMLPWSSAVNVTKEDEHLAALLPFVSAQRRGMAFATLHEGPAAGRGGPVLEVRIDGRRVGQLTPQMSKRYLPMVQHFLDRGLVTACRAEITGSAVAAKVRIFAAKADEASDELLNGEPVTLPPLAPQLDDPSAYDLSPLKEYLQTRTLPNPTKRRLHTEPKTAGDSIPHSTDNSVVTASDTEDLIAAIRSFADAREWGQFHTVRNLVLALTGEVGELAAEFQWIPDAGIDKAVTDPRKRAAVESEIADVAIYLLRLSDVLGINVATAVRNKLEINESRYLAQRTRGSARKYNESSTFVVFPASADDEAGQIEFLLRTGSECSGKEPPAGLARMLNELSERCPTAITIDRQADDRGAIISVAASEPDAFGSLFEAARTHEVATYDTTLQRLYVAKESVPVRALLGGRVAVPYVTPKLLEEFMRTPTWPDPDAPFFIIERDDDHYAQVYCHDDGSFDLEYRDGSPQQHFSVETSDRRLVTDALWAWALQDDDRLHNLVPWVRLSLDS